MTSHRRIHEMLTAYALDELSGPEAEQVKAHLATCELCRHELEQVARVVGCARAIHAQSVDETDAASTKARLLSVIAGEGTVSRGNAAVRLPSLVWRRITPARVATFAAAAAVMAAAGLLVYHIAARVDLSSKAFAQVVAEVKKARSVAYKSTTTYMDNEPFTSEVMMNADGVRRASFLGMVHVTDLCRGIYLQLLPGEKAAYRTRQTPQTGASVFNSLDFLATQHETGASYVGPNMVDGMRTDYYKLQREGERTSIWVDPQTNLPVRVVRERFAADDEKYLPVKQLVLRAKEFGCEKELSCGGALSGNFTPMHVKEVFTDFEWNVELDPSLLVTDIPVDYVEKHENQHPEPNESHLVTALEFWAQTSDGMLPTDVTELMDPDKVKPMLVQKFSNSEDPCQGYDDACDFMSVARAAASFAERKIIEGKWHAGERSVHLGDGSRLLYWWIDEQTGACRAMYGDLSVRDYDPESGSL